MSETDPAVLSEAVQTAQERFQYGRGTVETGLAEVESDAVGQLRKACRLLAAVRSLRATNGYHTAVVELSFGVIERSFEFFVLATSTETIREFDDHTYAYQRAFELGVISKDLRDDYKSLYTEYRSESYYGGRQVREGEADAMSDLAVATHEFLRDHPSDHYDCLCE
jgi:hypothetical protein